MKKTFYEYHVKDKENFDDLLKNAKIILDTNSLLNLYRYNSSNRNKYFEILTKVQDRLFLPHQVGREFYKNKENIINLKINLKNNLLKFFEDNTNNMKKSLENSEGKYGNFMSILKHEEDLKQQLISEMDLTLTKFNRLLDDFKDDSHLYKNDEILAKITELFENKVGKSFNKVELDKIYIEGELRYKELVPPGFKDDKDKTFPDKYGDLVIWKEIINLAQNEKCDILYISDDRKEDWAEKIEGKDKGPRKELIRELYENSGKIFMSLTTKAFIQSISDVLSIKETEELQREAESLQESLTHSSEEIINTSDSDFNSYHTEVLKTPIKMSEDVLENVRKYLSTNNNETINILRNSYDNEALEIARKYLIANKEAINTLKNSYEDETLKKLAKTLREYKALNNSED